MHSLPKDGTKNIWREERENRTGSGTLSALDLHPVKVHDHTQSGRAWKFLEDVRSIIRDLDWICLAHKIARLYQICNTADGSGSTS